MQPIVVQKFGGSSLADFSALQAVAQRIVTRARAGNRLVVVVSAMGKTTDLLMKQAQQLLQEPPQRELDMLLTAGERICMALLSIAIDATGAKAVSFTGSQSGIITDTSHQGAKILEVRPFRILDALNQDKIVIVAGYQGVSRLGEVTTLGRGGSDTTAVALAAALDASVCEIYSDVDGVFTADPRLCAQARLISQISYQNMQALADAGARVLNAQAIAFAQRAKIQIVARKTASDTNAQTVIAPTSAVKPFLAPNEHRCEALATHAHVTGLTGAWLEHFETIQPQLEQIGARIWAADASCLWIDRTDMPGRASQLLQPIAKSYALVICDVAAITAVGASREYAHMCLRDGQQYLREAEIKATACLLLGGTATFLVHVEDAGPATEVLHQLVTQTNPKQVNPA